MLLSRKEKETIISQFPTFDLCYEEHFRSKVQSPPGKTLYLAIPKGTKCFAWFRLYQGLPTCIIMERDKCRNYIGDVNILHACFDEMLCIGTIIHGVIVKTQKQQYFLMDDVYYYKGVFIGNKPPRIKLKYMEFFLASTKLASYSSRFIVFVLPLMNISRQGLIEAFDNLNYIIYCIQHRTINEFRPYKNERYVLDKNVVLLVRPGTQNDIYRFYCSFLKTEVEDGTLNIPDYKTSVMMNSLFRNIKENANLDTLEESDSEDDFENIDENKYILLKEQCMQCTFNQKIKRWEPVKISQSTNLTNKVTLGYLEKI
jgi:hypothetical protein